MVKKAMIPVGLFLLACLAVFTGCNQAPAPAYPRDGAAMVLSFPVPTPATHTVRAVPSKGPQSRKVQPRDIVYLTGGLFEYVITSGSEAVSGSVSISSAVTMGTVSIPLPHNGPWLVSAEWFDYGYSPRFVGATQAAVNGQTNVLIDMADISSYGCSHTYLSDTTYCYGYADLFAFDSDSSSYSTIGGTGDVQAFFDTNSATQYLAAAPGGTAKFAYLGTGDWVNFTQIPAGTTYYSDTEAAKNAVLGAGSVAALNDVYAVELNPNYHVWMQFTYLYTCTGGEIDFSYRINSKGLNYMDYDTTTYDHNYCTDLCYACGGS